MGSGLQWARFACMITYLLLPALAGKFTFESFTLQRLSLSITLASLTLGIPLGCDFVCRQLN